MNRAPDVGIEWTAGAIRRQSNLFESVLADGMSEPFFQKALGLDTGYRYRKVVDLLDYYYMPDAERVERYLRAKHKGDPAFFGSLVAKTYTVGERLLRIAERMGSQPNLATLGMDALVAQFVEYVDAALTTVPMAFASFPIEKIVEEEIRNSIQESISTFQLSRTVDDYFYDLVTFNVSATDYALVEERDLIALAAHLQTQGEIAPEVIQAAGVVELTPPIREALSRHSAEFGWINTDGYLGEPWADTDLLPRVQRWLGHDCRNKLDQIEVRKHAALERQRLAFDELGAGQELQRLVDLAGKYVELRPYRPMVLIKGGYLVRPFLHQLCRKLSITYADLMLYRHDEIVALSKGVATVDQTQLERRRKRRGYVVVDGTSNWFFGDEVDLVDRGQVDGQDYTQVTEISGQVANRGTAIGRARLLVDLLHLPEVADGEIIVASMTMPDMMPAMERAAAYITDEGGITCHAAIVSRELDVPCIIATRIATKAIRDGDLVEVDANRGRVLIHARADPGSPTVLSAHRPTPEAYPELQRTAIREARTHSADATTWLVDLASLSRADALLCGGKAANLGEMIQLGIPVAAGVAITTAAFHETIANIGFAVPEHEALNEAIRHQSRTPEDIRNLVLHCSPPARLISELNAFVQRPTAAHKRFAVRSSAGPEDGSLRSWAGQFETFLNIPADDVLDHILSCWASLLAPRALAYAKNARVDLLELGMAVVIQEFVNCDIAGTVFTRHPVTHDAGVLVVEAALGLGEALVAGKVTPDLYIVRKIDGTVVETNLSQQQLLVVARHGGGTETVKTDARLQPKPKLTEPHLREIVDASLKIERHFGSPQDIEFGFTGTQLSVFQARPITA